MNGRRTRDGSLPHSPAAEGYRGDCDGNGLVNTDDYVYVDFCLGLTTPVQDSPLMAPRINSSRGILPEFYPRPALGLCPFGHQGLFEDREFGGQLYVRTRNLPWMFMRWPQPDPAGYVDGLSRLLSLADNPISRTDPNGLDSFMYAPGGIIKVKYEAPYSGDDKYYVAGTWSWTAAGGGMQAIASTNGLVGYGMATDWMNHQRMWHHPELWSRFVNEHAAGQACGLDITEALRAAMQKVQKHWDGMSFLERCESCDAAMSVGPYFWRAWDLKILHTLSEDGFREPWRSVTISGRCYDAGAVNYVLFGYIGSLCYGGRDKQSAWEIIREKAQDWKGACCDTGLNLETEDWMWAGLHRWGNGGNVLPRSDTPYVPSNVKWDIDLLPQWAPYLQPRD